MVPLEMALIGDWDPSITAHVAIPKALSLSAEALGLSVQLTWLPTETLLNPGLELNRFGGLWCVPGSPYRSTEGALEGIRFARQNNIPFLGTCGGFQHALLEYARNVLGLTQAAHQECDPEAPEAVISRLACSLVETSQTIHYSEGSILARLHGSPTGRETFHCRYGLNPEFRNRLFERGDLTLIATDEGGEVRGFQYKPHPFFLATLYQPERTSLEQKTHPLISEFVRQAAKTKHSS